MDASSVSSLTSSAATSSASGTTSRERVLLVGHEPRLRESIRAQLGLDRYVCDVVVDGDAALRSAKVQAFDLIVMDLGAPFVAGRQISRMLRREPVNRRVPIVMIASRNAEADALTEIEHGADDFLVRPFGSGELTARARAAIHRARTSRAGAAVALTGPSATPPIRHGDIQIDPSRRHVQVKDRLVKLTEQEFQLLYVLATHAGVVFNREGLLCEIWGRDRFVTVRSVDTLVSRLRRRIEPGEQLRPRYLHTVRGVGYKLGDASEV
jgi:two-component system, OmpR family, response regulator MtrA